MIWCNEFLNYKWSHIPIPSLTVEISNHGERKFDLEFIVRTLDRKDPTPAPRLDSPFPIKKKEEE